MMLKTWKFENEFTKGHKVNATTPHKIPTNDDLVRRRMSEPVQRRRSVMANNEPPEEVCCKV